MSIKKIPIIDLFAGPGGLSEGFHQLSDTNRFEFSTTLSIEKDSAALKTLSLRTFFRSFEGRVPNEYYRYVQGRSITRDELFGSFPLQAKFSEQVVHNIELASSNDSKEKVDHLIEDRIGSKKWWVLLGGPPCQAYSLAGRSRMVGQRGRVKFEKDHRHFLYREYLRIIEKFQPPIFVMENVKGLVSAQHGGEGMFEKIRNDLSAPSKALKRRGYTLINDGSNEYLVYSLTVPAEDPKYLVPSDFVVKAEHYGVPQSRHRVIFLGIRADLGCAPAKRLRVSPEVSVGDVLCDLEPLRSKVSTAQKRHFDKFTIKTLQDETKSDGDKWHDIVQFSFPIKAYEGKNPKLDKEIRRSFNNLQLGLTTGGQFVEGKPSPKKMKTWFVDKRLKGFLNHESRGHMPSDFARYVYVASFGKVMGESPRIRDFPKAILPSHRNVSEARVNGPTTFADRFKVQLADTASSTIVSHISKDGHYYIHYDPTQCRSLTVREAARLQTFPDNYFFEGSRTEQYAQVGNAVPPYLARQIAGVVAATLSKIMNRI